MTHTKQAASRTGWLRIPNGTRVRHRHDAYEGVIDGLTELVSGPQRNPDGRTQYRINTGEPTRMLASEDNLSILLDSKELIIVGREREEYRRLVTLQLRATMPEDRFIKSGSPRPAAE